MAKLTVKIRTERYLDEISRSKGYVMHGRKGDFISARTPENKFIWVRLTPGKTTKPVHSYDTLTEAIKDKLDAGYVVEEYESVEDLV